MPVWKKQLKVVMVVGRKRREIGGVSSGSRRVVLYSNPSLVSLRMVMFWR